ncbi:MULTISPECIES: hypothetical protein [unclassified Mesorhizobium]|uniref:hypothetical protein n=1 Tax=unclassified Mesorhizobium TaxID=325217 RepID=UPI000BB02FC3|nr:MULTISPECIES: hypothetical protein [unclassified Mesorhizobium]TGT61013.1 hypothetical protein EN813_018795 [Mesorhizobium sp. M00.F.Ca.ET.170.01.1.1]AZO08783.1 hypothetical protein EJ074_06420 [Mesorhizobium sp. M3A.F.Ca.ET.080.04.2.1]PBB84070.1 hypothetical protein CK216_25135 [Mesorhizobium sp. WSM3876]RWB72092.1 MAG: hypothetical protein EOQ49_12635 [Mesorhizobium sp.]RWB83702.1 MAG: hypothetical protein EOQ52_26245 [Mesorhizobium sp.]
MFDDQARYRARQELLELVAGGMVSPGYAPPGVLTEMLEIAAMELKGDSGRLQRASPTDILTPAWNGRRIGDWMLRKGRSLVHGGIRFAGSFATWRLPA